MMTIKKDHRLWAHGLADKAEKMFPGDPGRTEGRRTRER